MSEVWRIVLAAPSSAAPFFERALESFADASLSILDADPGAGRRPGVPQPSSWQSDIWLAETSLIEGLASGRPDDGALQAAVAVAAAAAGIAAPDILVDRVAARDWVAETYRGFPEIAIGRYRLRGSHIVGAVPAGSIPICIDAAVAFGTGEHETTRGCLEALDRLGREIRPERILDVGCGSGILAIAAAKTWPSRIVAVDIDPRAVGVTRFNVRRNKVSARVTSLVADGYRARRVRRDAPYDLIIANILARPLARLAPDLARHLRRGGTVVLSGLLNWQEAGVRSAHRRQGLHLWRRITHGDWVTLVMRG